MSKETAIVELNGQVVKITKEPRMKGYMFYAIGRNSLPLATELALKQSSALRSEKDGDLGSWDDYNRWLDRFVVEGQLPNSRGLLDEIT